MTHRPPPPPPALEHMRAGTILHAGRGISTILPGLDFETYSEAGYHWNATTGKYEAPPGASVKGLPTIGMARYAMHPSTEVLCAAYDLKDGREKRLWTPGDLCPADLFDHIAKGGLIQAWNAGFEYLIWNHVCVKRYGWPRLPARQLRCAMARSRAHALPPKLADAGKALDIEHKKHADGLRLLHKFSMPRNPTKNDPRHRIPMSLEDADTYLMHDYNLQDVTAESEVAARCPDLSPFELEFWLCDQAINRRGVMLDRETIEASRVIIEETELKYNAELRLLTGGRVQYASEVAKIIKWLHSQGIHTDTLEMETLEMLLRRPGMDYAPKRVLEIRQLLSSAAVKKVYAMLNTMTPEDRVHDLFAYHASRTGRAAGQGVQPQNFPNSGLAVDECHACHRHFIDVNGCPWCGVTQYHRPKVKWGSAATNDAIECIRTRSSALVEMFYGNAIKTISSCLRGMFIASPGHDFICSDYKAIEAVVLAMLAGEQWQIDVFRTHGAIYEMAASKITGISLQDILDCEKNTGEHHEARKIGKISMLASGYRGWVGAWVNFGADKFLTEDQIKAAILEWRNASPAIVEFWGGQKRGKWRHELYGVEGMAVSAILQPGVIHQYRMFSFIVHNDVLYISLPSGRYLTYHNPRLQPCMRPGYEGTQTITFNGWNTNPKQGKMGWVRMETYSGKICENLCQAVARDLLAHAIVCLEHTGYRVVLHVHDEIVVEVPEGIGSVEDVERIMSTMPEWAADWPIKATGGWRAKRYAK